jgi:HSP20 family protein
MIPGEPDYQEYALRDYLRQFRLGDAVDPENIQAELKHGVLVIELPKAEKAKPKQIPVTVSS